MRSLKAQLMARIARNAPAPARRLHALLRARRHDELREELARAELAGEISEFYALDLQAILAIAEGSPLASDYLAMAEAAAATPYEVAIVAETMAAHDLHQGNHHAAAERCLATLDRVYQTEGLWIKLLIALSRLGDVETIDSTLRGFTRLDNECSGRLLRSLSAEPALRDVRARPAFRQLVESRVTG